MSSGANSGSRGSLRVRLEGCGFSVVTMTSRDPDGMGIVLGEMIGDAGMAAVDVGAAELFRRDHLARCRFDERRSAQKDRALVADDDALVRHRRHISAARRARSHHDRDLRNALRRHLGLIVEDAAEVALVGKDVVLLRQECAAGIDHVDARQAILARDVLRTKVLFHRKRIIGPALDGRIVGDDHALATFDKADAGNDAGGMHVAAIKPVCCERRQLEERRSPDRSEDQHARAQAACRARRGACGPPRRRPQTPPLACRAGQRPMRASHRRSGRKFPSGNRVRT